MGALVHACNASPPAKCKMAPRGPQNGRQDLERCLPIDFGRSHQLLLNNFFDPHTSSIRKSCNGEKKLENIMEKNFNVYSGH